MWFISNNLYVIIITIIPGNAKDKMCQCQCTVITNNTHFMSTPIQIHNFLSTIIYIIVGAARSSMTHALHHAWFRSQ